MRPHFTPDADTAARAVTSPEYRALVARGGSGRFLMAGEVGELRPSVMRPLRALAELAVALTVGVACIIYCVFA